VVYLHEASHHHAGGLAGLVVDVDHELDDLPGRVALQLALRPEHHAARLHQQVGELPRHRRHVGPLGTRRKGQGFSFIHNRTDRRAIRISLSFYKQGMCLVHNIEH